MMDAPFHVVRDTRIRAGSYNDTTVSTWAIMRTGVGVVCTCDDVSWAYIIVGLLNDEELQETGKAKLSAQGGSACSPSS